MVALINKFDKAREIVDLKLELENLKAKISRCEWYMANGTRILYLSEYQTLKSAIKKAKTKLLLLGEPYND